MNADLNHLKVEFFVHFFSVAMKLNQLEHFYLLQMNLLFFWCVLKISNRKKSLGGKKQRKKKLFINLKYV